MAAGVTPELWEIGDIVALLEAKDSPMDSFSCDECRAIYLDLLETARAARMCQPEETITRRGLVKWVQQLSEEDCARMRQDSNLWRAWRKLQEHRDLTGHYLPVLPLPPGAVSNSN
jgi:hypothetical protein